MPLKPFIKWAGGKRQLLPQIKAHIPQNTTRIVELFVGGGALFLDLMPTQAIINDSNSELMLSYKEIKYNPQQLMEALNHYSSLHSEEFYYNTRAKKPNELSNVEIAARFIYMNKACFNGLYRLNSKGQFNVPFGKKASINLYDKENILGISNYLNNNDIQILNYDYLSVFDFLASGDFIFADPPYDKLNDTSFVGYSKIEFSRADQTNLAQALDSLSDKNINWLLTNHNTEFINTLYSKYYSKTYTANRMINSDAAKRKTVLNEIFIMNNNNGSNIKSDDDFNNLMSTMVKTNHTLDFFVDWAKVSSNIRKIEINLHALDYLLGKINLDNAINELFEINPKCFKALPILIALRNTKISYFNTQTKQITNNNFDTLEEIKYFIKETGLWSFFTKYNIARLIDYVYGVEVGLDTNARKNRVGKVMEQAISDIFHTNNFNFASQVDIKQLDPEFMAFGDDIKKFDFMITTSQKKFLIEVNFYNSSGSKLNETSRAYKNIAHNIKKFSNYEFIWITDGAGWDGAKTKLKEAYFEIDHIYNLSSLDQFINFVKNN